MASVKLLIAICLFSSPLFAAEQPATDAPTTKPATHVKKVEKPPHFIPAKDDPALGDWQGEHGIVAQVFIAPTGEIQANLLKSFDTEDNNIAVLHGTHTNDTI